MNEYIRKYIDQGFYLFPCNTDKTPMTRHGFYNANNTYEIVQKQFFKNDLYIGFPTGKKNKIVIIDFDINKKIPGTDSIDPRSVEDLIEEVKTYGELPDTFQVSTPSGGRHFYYLLPEGVETGSATRFIDKSLPVDIRGDGGYVIAPDGNNYYVYDDIDDLEIDDLINRCAVLPDWIVEIRKKRTEDNVENRPENVLPESEIREIRSALSYISSDDRDMWIRIGMCLKSTGSPSAYGLWNEWSKTSDKYNPNDMEKRWKGLKPHDVEIGTLFHEAKKLGWVTTYNQSQIIPVGQQELLPPAETETSQSLIDAYQKQPFPEDLLRPEGLVGDIIDFILTKSIKPQPVFALSAALSVVGALAGRKVQTETGIRTNIYCLNVGSSGCGKESPRKTIKELLEAAGCGHLGTSEDLASDSAIVNKLDNNESQIFLLDEIGRFLETTKKGESYLKNIITVLLKLYSSADQTFHGKDYADKTKKVTLIQPNLCLLGTTVPETLYKGLSYENALDGFLSRMLIFETDNNRPKKERNKDLLVKPPKELVNQIKKLFKKPINLYPQGNLEQIFCPDPQVVTKTNDACKMLWEFDDYIDVLRDTLDQENRVEATYNRTAQLAEQLALIVAVGRDIDNPIITEHEMSYGIRLAKHLADHMHYIVENYMAKNELEHEVKRILKLVRDSGAISISEISRKSQNLPGHIRNDIIETLKQSGQVQEDFIGTGVYARRMLTAIN
jgi:hypothetical protein